MFLDFHPVARGGLFYLVALHGARHLNLSSEEQELLRQCGLSCIGVADDGKRASAFYFRVHLSVLSMICVCKDTAFLRVGKGNSGKRELIIKFFVI